MLFSAIGITILLGQITQYISADVPSIQTSLGTITGETKSVTFQNKVYQYDRYLGIPYAKPPTGDLRFQPPEPVVPFSETYNAVEFGASCPQPSYPSLPAEKKIDEDCLFLNIFVPRDQEPDKPSGHAVMLFLHGGGFTAGSGTGYDGSVLSSVGNVVVITINYRLGVLGFLDIDNDKAPGNVGLLDQHQSLKWVNENIGAFGGDKDRVTLFGQSSGSSSVGMQMMYPSNNGLITNCISESGPIGISSIYQENNIETANLIASNMNCSTNTIDIVLECLKEAPFENIIQALLEGPADGESAAVVGVSPTIDGKFIKRKLDVLLMKAENETSEEVDFFRSLNLMTGMSGSEGGLYIAMYGDAETLENFILTREQMNTHHIPVALIIGLGNKPIPEVAKRLIISQYTDWESPDDPERLRDQAVDLYGDIVINAPTIEMIRVHSNSSNANSYVYNFLPKVDKPMVKTPSWVKSASHGDELGPVFGYKLDLKSTYNITDYTPPEWELALSIRMMKYWTNFAKSGEPNKPETGVAVVWPKYNISYQSYLKFDRADSIGQYLYARQTDFWKDIIPDVIDSAEHAQCEQEEEEKCEKDGTCAFNGDGANRKPYICVCYIFFLTILHTFMNVPHLEI